MQPLCRFTVLFVLLGWAQVVRAEPAAATTPDATLSDPSRRPDAPVDADDGRLRQPGRPDGRADLRLPPMMVAAADPPAAEAAPAVPPGAPMPEAAAPEATAPAAPAPGFGERVKRNWPWVAAGAGAVVIAAVVLGVVLGTRGDASYASGSLGNLDRR